ncbi:helix-turn-helix DNA binding protein [Gordonia phage Easley]|uniref:Helix-turn-helix DNA binding protein n=1 Tax=Gordonia phage Easley TaxID=2182395 RepID=A0A2U8UNS6_9CAUD|nr:helix-turn-helix DNA binding protein [Gordonia phage Easley]AWN05066.1 helix-turn-helix DNA binding protein [Gordonia phage Easley]
MEVKDPAKLRRERKQKRYTQRELGMLVRRTQTTIYKLETGQLKNITEDLALAIAARLDCHWEDLFVAHEEEVAPGSSAVSTDGRRVPA